MAWDGGEAAGQRASHEDRERTAEVLRVAAGDGRLTLEELDERLEACFAARTYADLAALVGDLPGEARQVASAPPKEVVRVRRAGGSARFKGAWAVPKRLEAEVRGGNVLLDFTAATVAGPVTEVDVEIHGGNLRLVVPEGYAVDSDEVEFRGGSVTDRRAKGGLAPGGPVVHRVVVTGEIVGGRLVVSAPREPGRPGLLRRLLGRR